MVGDAGGSAVGIGRREALARRPGESLGKAEEDEEEDFIGLCEDEKGVALVVYACHSAIAHLWGRGTHADEACPSGRDCYGRLLINSAD